MEASLIRERLMAFATAGLLDFTVILYPVALPIWVARRWAILFISGVLSQVIFGVNTKTPFPCSMETGWGIRAMGWVVFWATDTKTARIPRNRRVIFFI